MNAARASDPTTPIQARRHLLLHLDDARQLRRNPIAAMLFGSAQPRSGAERRALSQVRSAVRRAAETMIRQAAPGCAAAMQRRYAIVTRCDLQGEPHKAVARALGISMRQFYRERREAAEEVGTLVADWIGGRTRSSEPVYVVDPFEIALRQATALRFAGRHRDASETLESTARSAGTSPNAIRAWCSLADSLTESGEFAGAGRALEAAETRLEGLREGGICVGAMRARLLLSRARLWETKGDIELARESVADCVAFAKAASGQGTDMSGLMAWTTVMNATYDIRSGDFDRARQVLERANDAIETLEAPEPDLLVEYLVRRGEVGTLLPSDDYDVVGDYNRAAILSQRYGFATGLINAIAVYASHLLIQGELGAAAAHIRGGLSIQSLRGASIYGGVELIASEIAFAANDATQGLAYARSARASLCEGGCDWGRTYSKEADAYYLTGDYARALPAAFTAIDVFRGTHSERFSGWTLSTIALCYAGLGRREEALAYADDAVALLESKGHPRSLRRARRIRAAVMPT